MPNPITLPGHELAYSPTTGDPVGVILKDGTIRLFATFSPAQQAAAAAAGTTLDGVIAVGANGQQWDKTGAPVSGGVVTVTPTHNMFFGDKIPPIANSSVTGNTSAGSNALASLTTGNSNTVFGDNAGALLNGAGGDGNTVAALNTLIGANSGESITTGLANTCIGQKAGRSITTGVGNICMGKSVGVNLVAGTANVLLGGAKGTFSGDQNVCIGELAGENNTGSYNMVLGATAGQNLSGSGNTLAGRSAGAAMTTSSEQVMVGAYAGTNLTNQFGNTFIGGRAGAAATGSECTFVGSQAGNNASGGQNTFAGNAAGYTVTTGAQNSFYGFYSGNGPTNLSNLLGVGAHSARYANSSGQVFIDTRDRANISNAQHIGLIYAETSATAAAQRINLNANTRIGAGNAPVVSGLPGASASLMGYRGYVTDASVAYASATLGTTVIGGGSNCVPVFCTGSSWVIG